MPQVKIDYRVADCHTVPINHATQATCKYQRKGQYRPTRSAVHGKRKDWYQLSARVEPETAEWLKCQVANNLKYNGTGDVINELMELQKHKRQTLRDALAGV